MQKTATLLLLLVGILAVTAVTVRAADQSQPSDTVTLTIAKVDIVAVAHGAPAITLQALGCTESANTVRAYLSTTKVLQNLGVVLQILSILWNVTHPIPNNPTPEQQQDRVSVAIIGVGLFIAGLGAQVSGIIWEEILRDTAADEASKIANNNQHCP